MRYKSLSVKNYKGIKEVSIDFTYNRILTLVGLNESGKTTVLEAVHLFYELLKDKKLSLKDLNDCRPKSIGFTGDIILTGTLEFEAEDHDSLRKYAKSKGKKMNFAFPKEFTYTYRFSYQLHKFKQTNKTCIFDVKSGPTNKKLVTSNKLFWDELITHVRKELIPEILYYEDFIFEIPDKITFALGDHPESTEANPETDKEWKLVFDDILRSVSPEFETFQEYVVDIWKDDNDTARQRIAVMEKQLDKKITQAWKKLFDDSDGADNQRLNFKEIKLVPIVEEGEKISFSFKVKTDGGKEFSINERSKGCKWFFSFLIFTEFRKNRTNNILFLLDEPASNLHSSAQLKILDAIESLSDKSVIAYSTHSHHLIHPKWLGGAFVVINEGISTSNLEGALTDTDAKISITRYYDYVSKNGLQSQTLYYQPILDRLDYKPSLIDPIPNIVISEGKNDWFTFKFISELYFSNNTQKLHFYPGKGANSNSDIMRLYLAWGSKFILILDGDNAGIKAKNEYIKELGQIVADRIFTLDDILSEKIVTEDIFTESDLITICDTAFGENTYDNLKDDKKQLKSKINFAINQLLVNKTVKLPRFAPVRNRGFPGYVS